MINKVIHYCWFGNKKKNKKILKCIESWKKFFPDYELKEWNEKNFNIHINKYVEEAYEQEKWAFVSDYARLWILYNFGGIYFDTDVMVLKKFDDNIKMPLLAIELGVDYNINPGLIMCARKGDLVCEKILNEYDNESFLTDNGLNQKTICERFTELFIKEGFKKENIYQNILGYHIYPTEFFCPYDNYRRTKNITKKTYTVHLYLGSWLTTKEKITHFVNYIIRRIKK